MVGELPSKLENKASQKGRTSVSAEAFGAWNKKGDFKPPVIPKSDATKQ